MSIHIEHKHIVIIGRMNGDEEDHARDYPNATIAQARQAFVNEVRADEGVQEVDVVAGYEFTEVHINFVLTSTTPINIEEN